MTIKAIFRVVTMRLERDELGRGVTPVIFDSRRHTSLHTSTSVSLRSQLSTMSAYTFALLNSAPIFLTEPRCGRLC